MTHIFGFERSQLLLLPETVDDYVGADNPVRFIDAFVDQLDLAAAGGTLRDMRTTSWSVNAIEDRTNIARQADGSVDIYFGPKAPAGKDSNWVPTNPRGQFEVLFRFYGPEKPLFDKTWKLPDIERITAQGTRRAKP
jgi:hypothetical protein